MKDRMPSTVPRGRRIKAGRHRAAENAILTPLPCSRPAEAFSVITGGADGHLTGVFSLSLRVHLYSNPLDPERLQFRLNLNEIAEDHLAVPIAPGEEPSARVEAAIA